mmetsp:Transcript_89033/g.276747  ORF Transcript_89033/g.276747 Transcript_89033/m.276747 type:complete len:233 (-) Transcript_89033:168-866(-)
METSGRGAADWVCGAASEDDNMELECWLPTPGGRPAGPPGLGSGRTRRRRCQRRAQLARLRQLAAPVTPPATGAFAGGAAFSPVKATAALDCDSRRDTKDSGCHAQQFPSGNPIDFVLEFMEDLEVENEHKAVWINQLKVGCVQRCVEALESLVDLEVVEIERGRITGFIGKGGNKIQMEWADSDPEDVDYGASDSNGSVYEPGSDDTWEAEEESSEEVGEGGPSGLGRSRA